MQSPSCRSRAGVAAIIDEALLSIAIIISMISRMPLELRRQAAKVFEALRRLMPFRYFGFI